MSSGRLSREDITTQFGIINNSIKLLQQRELKLVQDTSPQLGGDLDLNGHNIIGPLDFLKITGSESLLCNGAITVGSYSTAEINAFSGDKPRTGMWLFNTTVNKHQFYNGTQWVSLDGGDQEVTIVLSQVTTLLNQVTTLQSSLNNISTDVSLLNGAKQSRDNKILSLEADVISLASTQNDITALTQQDIKLGNLITALQAQYAQLSTQISALTQQDINLGNLITALQAQYAQLSTQISVLETALGITGGTGGNLITALQAQYTQLSTQISVLETALQSQDGGGLTVPDPVDPGGGSTNFVLPQGAVDYDFRTATSEAGTITFATGAIGQEGGSPLQGLSDDGIQGTPSTYVSLPPPNVPSEFTMEIYMKTDGNIGTFWHMHDSTPEDSTSQNNGSSRISFEQFWDGSDNFSIWGFTQGGHAVFERTYNRQQYDQYQHIVMIFTQSFFKFFIDGVEQAITGSNSVTGFRTGARNSFVLGRSMWGDNANENVKFIRYYPRALTTTEIETLSQNKDNSVLQSQDGGGLTVPDPVDPGGGSGGGLTVLYPVYPGGGSGVVVTLVTMDHDILDFNLGSATGYDTNTVTFPNGGTGNNSHTAAKYGSLSVQTDLGGAGNYVTLLDNVNYLDLADFSILHNLTPNQPQSGTFSGSSAIVTFNTATAPNGSTEAFRLARNGTSNNKANWYVSGGITFGSNSMVLSCWAKGENGNNYFVWSFSNLGGSIFRAGFRLEGDGETQIITSGNGGHTLQIQKGADGWYRCIIVGDTRSSGATTQYLYTANGYNENTSTVGGSTLFWGFQLETGSVASSFTPNASVSFEAYFRWGTANRTQRVFAFGNTGWNTMCFLALGNGAQTGKLEFAFFNGAYNASTTTRHLTTNNNYTSTTDWYHVVVVEDETDQSSAANQTTKMYINAVLAPGAESSDAVSNVDFDNSVRTNHYLGSGSNFPGTGSIDLKFVRVHRAALTSAQIQLLYHSRNNDTYVP